MNPLAQLLKFLTHLDSLGAGYMLSSDTDAIIVLVRTDAGIHEVSFFGDGAIEVSTFGASEEPESVNFAELLEGFSAEDEQKH